MIRHVISLLRSGQLRFRAETFGLYHRGLPEQRPVWRLNAAGLLLLLNSARRYAAWRSSMAAVARHGPHEWWGRRFPAIDLEGELGRLSIDDSPPSPPDPVEAAATRWPTTDD
jgi:hypothetical protein